MKHKVTEKRILYNVPEWSDRPVIKRLAEDVRDMVEPLLTDAVHGWRPKRNVASAVLRIHGMSGPRAACDVRSYFANVDLRRLKKMVNRLDPMMWGRIEPWLPDEGLPEGCSFSPHLANLYLAPFDERFPLTRYGDNLLLVDPDAETLLSRLRTQLLDVGLMTHQVELDPRAFCKWPLNAVCRSACVETGGGWAVGLTVSVEVEVGRAVRHRLTELQTSRRTGRSRINECVVVVVPVSRCVTTRLIESGFGTSWKPTSAIKLVNKLVVQSRHCPGHLNSSQWRSRQLDFTGRNSERCSARR